MTTDDRTGKKKRPTQCPHGHLYTAENSFFTRREGYIRCRECDRQRGRERRYRAKQQA